MSLGERRADADLAARAARIRRATLARRIALLRTRAEPHRPALTVAAGLVAGMLAARLSVVTALRAGMLGIDAWTLLARGLPRARPAHAGDRPATRRPGPARLP